MYAWMGPFIGALIRPVGGWIADKVGGAKVTQVVTIVMIASALGVAYFMKLAYVSATPEEYFVPFFLLFLVLFAGTGIGNGSTFRTTAMIFPKEQAGPALGWTSAVAAYGAFIIPKVFGEQIKAATPEYALYGFAAFYAVCLLMNWWYYLGPKERIRQPVIKERDIRAAPFSGPALITPSLIQAVFGFYPRLVLFLPQIRGADRGSPLSIVPQIGKKPAFLATRNGRSR